MTVSLLGRVSNGWPDFRFDELPISQKSKMRLQNAYDYVRIGGTFPNKKSALLKIILKTVFDRSRGLYLPVSPFVNLPKRIPTFAYSLHETFPAPYQPFSCQYFSNALIIPEAFFEGKIRGDELQYHTSPPKLRQTSCGLLFITLEVDVEAANEFEETLSWTGEKKNALSVLQEVDEALKQFSEYRGYSVVYSGGKSLHFHFLYNIEHIKACRFDESASERWKNSDIKSSVVERLHEEYWGKTYSIFLDRARTSLSFDTAMNSNIQFRRSPWAVRTHEKHCIPLDISVGTTVPQIVIEEDIRSRSCAGASPLISADFSTTQPRNIVGKKKIASQIFSAVNELIEEIGAHCEDEWGPEAHPIPVSAKREGPNWVVNFQNSRSDRRPSTYIRGDYHKLELCGKNNFTKEFHLSMSANELCEYYNLKIGGGYKKSRYEPLPSQGLIGFAACQKNRGLDPLKQLVSHHVKAFESAIQMGENLPEVVRKRLNQTLSDFLVDGNADLLVTSAEGIGKSTACLRDLHELNFDRAVRDQRGFSAFAFRSHQQKWERVEEFEKLGYKLMGIDTFWSYLDNVCRILDRPVLSKESFKSGHLFEILSELKTSFPEVYDMLEEQRKSLWIETPFAVTTILMMTHQSAITWHQSHLTRLWYHPSFDPENDDSANTLWDEMALDTVVFDDPEIDSFVQIINEPRYSALLSKRERFKDWRNISLVQRRKNFAIASTEVDSPFRAITFDDFDALMRMDLTRFEEIKVDFARFPFGRDNAGMYKDRDGEKRYVSAKPWLRDHKSRFIYLTTEEVISSTIKKSCNDVGRNVVHLPLDYVPSMYPISLPLKIDKRARAIQKSKPNEGLFIDAIADEVLSNDPNAIVIANGLGDKERVFNFQTMKGLNGLKEKNIQVILTWLSPEEYIFHNVLGQYCDDEEIFSHLYQDRLNQAVGRNTGFRETGTGQITKVICSKEFEKKVLRTFQYANRITYFIEDDKRSSAA